MDGRRFRSLCANMDRLTVGQIRDLTRKLGELDARKEVLARIDGRAQALERCLHCGARALVRWGETRTGLQRLRCKACRRTLLGGDRHGGGAHPPAGEARAGSAGHARAGAELVWRWRMRILAALRGIGAARLAGIVEADEKYFRELRKGSREWVRHAREPSRFPKPDRLRWRDFRRLGLLLPAGLSKWQVPVLTLADRAGDRRADMLPDRRAESLVAVLDAHIGTDAVLCSDGDGAYGLFARARRLPHYRLNAKTGPKVIDTAFHIQTVNYLHSRFETFMRPFPAVPPPDTCQATPHGSSPGSPVHDPPTTPYGTVCSRHDQRGRQTSPNLVNSSTLFPAISVS